MKIKLLLNLLTVLIISCSVDKKVTVIPSGQKVPADEFRIQIKNNTGKDKLIKVSKILYNPAMSDTSTDEIISGGKDKGVSRFVKFEFCTEEFNVMNQGDSRTEWHVGVLNDNLRKLYPISDNDGNYLEPNITSSYYYDSWLNYNLNKSDAQFSFGDLVIGSSSHWLGLNDFESLYVEISDADNTADTIRIYGVDKNTHDFQEKNAVYDMGYFWKGEDIDGTGRSYVMDCPVSTAVITINGDATSDIVIEKIMDVIE